MRQVGLTLEIVPLVDPYGEPRPATLPVRIFYEGRVLPGALVKLIDLGQELASVDARRTDRSGVAQFAMPRSGSWLVSAVWTKRLEHSPDAEFETIFASLTFGFAGPAHGVSRADFPP